MKKELPIALLVMGFVALSIYLGARACSPAPPPVPPTAPSVVPETTPSSQPSNRPFYVDPDYVSLEEVDEALGTWRGAGARMMVTSRDKAKDLNEKYGSIYPYQMVLHTDSGDPYRCGFYPKLHPPGWRVGYCTGGGLDPEGGAHALRIVIQRNRREANRLYVQIGDRIGAKLEKVQTDGGHQ